MSKNKLSEKVKKARKKPGGSNVGEYSSKETCVGPAGGAPKGSYPITKNGKLSLERATAALRLAHNAPNPAGIKRAVYSKFPQLKANKMQIMNKK